MTRLSELLIDSDTVHQQQQKAHEKAITFITIAVYLLFAGVLMEYVSIANVLKIIGFILTGHAFYFLWRSHMLTKM